MSLVSCAKTLGLSKGVKETSVRMMDKELVVRIGKVRRAIGRNTAIRELESLMYPVSCVFFFLRV